MGADWLADAVLVDQSPIGKTARSNPASYVGAFDAVLALFAAAPLVSGAMSSRNPACSGGSWSIGGNRLSDTGGRYTPPAEE